MSTAVSFAFAAGLLATVNPCGFTMLPSFLTFYLGAHEQDGASRSLLARVREGLTVGAVLSLAFGAVFVVVGLLVSAGLRTVIEVVPWLAVAVAVGLLAVGAAMLAGRHVGLMSASRVTVTPGTSGGYRRVALFGVTYALASLSCTLAVFLVVVGQALAVADPVQLVVVFAAYAAGSASLLIALSVSAALAKGALARAVRRLLPAVNRVSGTLLIGSGIYLLLYAAVADRWDARRGQRCGASHEASLRHARRLLQRQRGDLRRATWTAGTAGRGGARHRSITPEASTRHGHARRRRPSSGPPAAGAAATSRGGLGRITMSDRAPKPAVARPKLSPALSKPRCRDCSSGVGSGVLS